MFVTSSSMALHQRAIHSCQDRLPMVNTTAERALFGLCTWLTAYSLRQ
jgi:hypothetical protein